MSLEFVNLNGQRVSTTPVHQAKKRIIQQDQYHKGFRVVGIAPGSYEEAQRERQADIEAATRQKQYEPLTKIPAPLAAYETWASQAKKKPVRSKPYELLESAQLCRELAQKQGWDRVQVVEVKRVLQGAV
jgi:hypothetical protein